MEQLLPHLKKAALASGRVLLKHRDNYRDLTQFTKSRSSDYATQADLDSESEAVGYLRKKFPHAVFNAEEGGARHSKGLVFDIDPLDGTIPFTFGQPHYSVVIAARERNSIKAGVVYFPTLKQLFYAQAGKGAWLEEKGKKTRLTVRDSILEKAVVATDYPYDPVRRAAHSLNHGKLFVKARYSPVFGCGAYGLCQVAKGNFNAFFHPHLDSFGSTAGILLVQEAGGVVTDYAGKSIDFSDKDYSPIIASARKPHRELLELVRK